jgi:hypothetical protein
MKLVCHKRFDKIATVLFQSRDVLLLPGVESLRCEDSNPVLNTTKCFPCSKFPRHASIARPGVLLNGPLGRGLERGCAGRAFVLRNQEGLRVRAKKARKKPPKINASMKTTPLPYAGAGAGANQISCVKISRETRELHASTKHEIADSLAKFTGIAIAKASSMKTIIRNLFAALVLGAGSLQLHAQGLVIDQESYPTPISPVGDGYVDGLLLTDQNLGETFEQTFVPSLSAIDFIALEFESSSVPAQVIVNLYEGSPSISGQTLLGTTTAVMMPSGLNNNGLDIAGVQDFYFPTPIPLTPGDEYYFSPHLELGGSEWNYVTLIDFYTYPNGQLDVNGYPYINSTDMWFQEGVVAVPEPTTLALIGFTCLLVLGFKLRSKLPVLMFASLLLLTVPVLSVNASDSVVQATASEAGLPSVSTLPKTGTFYIATINSNSGLIALPPYPMLPTNMTDLPAFLVTNDIFILDNTKGQLTSSTETMTSDAATAAVKEQAQTVESLIETIETPPIPNGGPEGTNSPSGHPNDLPPVSDATNIWLLATNDANGSSLDMTLMNGTGNNVQLLSTTNLLLKTNWCLGPILQGANVNYNNVFTPIPCTNDITFFRVHEANPILEVYNSQGATEPTTNSSAQVGNFIIQNNSYDTTNDIIVYFTLSGTGQNGIDYSNIPGSVVLSNSLGYAQINIDPLTNGIEPNKTIIITLTQNTNYLIVPGYDSNTNLITATPQIYPIVNGDTLFPCPNATTILPLQVQNPGNLTLAYTFLNLPTHGTLNTNTLSDGYVSYATSGCFEGQDSFTYKVTGNGQYAAGPATVTLDVSDPMNSSPTLVQTCRGTPVTFNLNVSDNCGETLSNYTLLSTPFYGTLSNWPNTLTFTFTPDGTDFTGTNAFNYIAYSDCGGDSTTNSVAIIIGDQYISTTPQNLITGTNLPVAITLSASGNSDCNEDTNDFVYAVTSEPANGTLTNVSGANLTYKPATNFEGVDSFQFVASDGVWTNSPAAITVDVVEGPILIHDCNPFGTGILLDWELDTNCQAMNLNIQDYIVYQSSNATGPWTPVFTNSAGTDEYTESNAVVGVTNYFTVTFQAYNSFGNLIESPKSDVVQAVAQVNVPLIPYNAVWQVVTNLATPNNITNLEAPMSNYFLDDTNQPYPGMAQLPNSYWAVGTTMSNSINMVIPTNSVPLDQVTYSIAIDNDYQIYLNDSNAPIQSFNHEGYAIWVPYQSFESVAPGLLHYGTNSLRVVITDEGGINYFSMIVSTNACGM